MAGMEAPRRRVCGAPTRRTHSALILGRPHAAYWHRARCGFWFINEPHWVPEAYTEAIVDADTGLVARNWLVARRLTPLLLGMFGRDGTFVDYAGGYGLLVRLVRDSGFDFYWQDNFAERRSPPGRSGQLRQPAGPRVQLGIRRQVGPSLP